VSASLLFAVVFLTTCERSRETARPAESLRIGAILSLTGSAAQYGKWSQNGIELAVSEINSAGGVDGKPLEIIYEDDASVPGSAVSAAKKLIAIDHVSAIIGPLTSSSVLAAAPVAEAGRVVLLSPCGSSPKITEAGDYIFRNWPSDNFEGSAMADFLAQQLHFKRVVVVAMNNEYGIGLRDVFVPRAKELGLQILDVMSFEQGATDFRAQAARVAELKPDVVYAPGHAREVAMLIRQSREIGVKAVFVSGVAFGDPDVFTIAGSAADGTYFTAPSFDPTSQAEIVKKFQASYAKRFHTPGEVFAGHAYDAVRILAKAFRDAGGDAAKVKDALYAIKHFPGVTGDTTFDKNGDVTKPVTIKVANGGSFKEWVR